jgi:hypothetical protein
MAAQFNQSEMREVLNLPPETVRHWRRVLPPLAQRTRRVPFSTGDLVALALVRKLVHDFGLNVSALAAQSNELFRLCNRRPWPALAQCRLEIAANFARFVPVDAKNQPSVEPYVVVSVGPIIELISAALLRERDVQAELIFPLNAQAGGN